MQEHPSTIPAKQVPLTRPKCAYAPCEHEPRPNSIYCSDTHAQYSQKRYRIDSANLCQMYRKVPLPSGRTVCGPKSSPCSKEWAAIQQRKSWSEPGRKQGTLKRPDVKTEDLVRAFNEDPQLRQDRKTFRHHASGCRLQAQKSGIFVRSIFPKNFVSVLMLL